tara:strand:- start:8095 stop:8865 length:771 start_codon:yes stop_codon:yes gene_type:complete
MQMEMEMTKKEDKNREFYDDLIDGKIKRGLLGVDKRFNPDVRFKPSIQKFFVREIESSVCNTDVVLDLGCGVGAFLAATAPYCAEIVGIDISENFVRKTNDLIAQENIINASTKHQINKLIPAENNSFDVVIMIDVVHHLVDINETLKEVRRVLKPCGSLLIFEPNKLNPLMFLLHIADKNEWGLLALGSPQKYRATVGKIFDINRISWSGLVVGPESKIFHKIAIFLDKNIINKLLGWLQPKIFISAKNPPKKLG